MSGVAAVVKSVGPKLVPFFKTVAIYFVVFLPYNVPSVLATILKCLPIVSLMLFVVLHGMSLGDEYRYARRILVGLIFCCLGDAFLIWPGYFEIGMLAFAIGHIHYILAFGFKPLNLKLGLSLFAVSFIGLAYLMPGLNGILVPGVFIYTLVLTTMVWRASARVDLWTWSKLCSCTGGILFGLSDLVLGFDIFLAPVAYSQAIVMSTYYTAQLGIALSVVDAKPQNSFGGLAPPSFVVRNNFEGYDRPKMESSVNGANLTIFDIGTSKRDFLFDGLYVKKFF